MVSWCLLLPAMEHMHTAVQNTLATLFRLPDSDVQPEKIPWHPGQRGGLEVEDGIT